jgi:hypothetical protein
VSGRLPLAAEFVPSSGSMLVHVHCASYHLSCYSGHISDTEWRKPGCQVREIYVFFDSSSNAAVHGHVVIYATLSSFRLAFNDLLLCRKRLVDVTLPSEYKKTLLSQLSFSFQLLAPSSWTFRWMFPLAFSNILFLPSVQKAIQCHPL